MSEHEAVVKAIEGIGKILWDHAGMDEAIYEDLLDLKREVTALAENRRKP